MHSFDLANISETIFQPYSKRARRSMVRMRQSAGIRLKCGIVNDEGTQWKSAESHAMEARISEVEVRSSYLRRPATAEEKERYRIKDELGRPKGNTIHYMYAPR